MRRTPGGGNELKRIYGPDLHSDYRHSGSTGRLRLFVGVTNDAVNFPQLGYRIEGGPRRVILIVASIGILVGTLTSSGMMEVARNGMFDPGMFSFHEVILLYLSVMFANIILLDLYNSWGLPTSTTVSLIFCLLGAAIAVSTFKIAGSDALSMGDLGEFIHAGRAFGIVAAILLSVVIALTVGTAVMYVSRLIFSFRYTRALSRYGALWCGASLTAIIYFALFKGTQKGRCRRRPSFIRSKTISFSRCWSAG